VDDFQQQLLAQLKRIADSLELAYPKPMNAEEDAAALAYVWQAHTMNGSEQRGLVAVRQPSLITFDQLKNIDRQKKLIEHNTRCFVEGLPANNVLLTGARGTGKSSLVKACLAQFHTQGLRLVEIDKDHLADLPRVIQLLAKRPEKFIIVCDDLSFEEGDAGYKSLKTTLDGTIAAQSANVLIYATSNRRHLMAARASDNLQMTRGDNGALNPGEEVEEKVSLAERFGLWISFYAFSPDEYLAAVNEWLTAYDVPADRYQEAHTHAIRWATQRGSKSGRIAAQFAKSFANNSHL
jgi:predicted AAA+ superfamily ATPase